MNFDSTLQRIPTGGSNEYRPAPARHMTWRSRLTPKDPWAKGAVIWATSQLLVIVILEAAIAKIHGDYRSELEALNDPAVDQSVVPNARAITIYHALFIVAQAFQWVLAADAVLTSSMIQLVSTTLYNTALFAYSIVQFKQAKDIADQVTQLGLPNLPKPHPTKTPEFIVIVAMAIFAAGWMVISQRLYRVFGWSIFKELGADIAVRNRLKLYHIYMMLLKLDVFFFLGFDIQFLLLVLLNDGDVSSRWTHGLIAIPFTLILLVIAYFAIRKESNILMTLTLLGLSGGIGYLIAKLVDVMKKGDTPKYSGSRNSLTFFESITLALSVATFVVAIMNFRNFGKGLKEQLERARGQNMELDDIQRPPKDNRWTLD
ncbi:uncharacterized protein SPPG_07907 [Spizellomyces punctatus DAOM BR117]|uniref:TRP C-terminal domain-containing protein n=1 Tax=Spizellomyces punctatus (strain DAOM BR117) TaxID=645134 RepID=A0A0L0H5B4_SPIPD|nr:uncharacterized protein SPPG_07907 [Spizellomyces punctatus DAOM BR117]KNC96695.1 hypothetical protein SPPG_07907 [Spizellomyces punctatus DAOM BR117]|eukprot:XP_016604735.1 hypothetical protein SPPG_07907 [Spizellomyces punctatus DAOM BR117]